MRLRPARRPAVSAAGGELRSWEAGLWTVAYVFRACVSPTEVICYLKIGHCKFLNKANERIYESILMNKTGVTRSVAVRGSMLRVQRPKGGANLAVSYSLILFWKLLGRVEWGGGAEFRFCPGAACSLAATGYDEPIFLFRKMPSITILIIDIISQLLIGFRHHRQSLRVNRSFGDTRTALATRL